jgi:hypothetical protein
MAMTIRVIKFPYQDPTPQIDLIDYYFDFLTYLLDLID